MMATGLCLALIISTARGREGGKVSPAADQNVKDDFFFFPGLGVLRISCVRTDCY
jgi:hypothetical protein